MKDSQTWNDLADELSAMMRERDAALEDKGATQDRLIESLKARIEKVKGA
jgi:ElaB/YqjD/DUF883 family membrane-anchored ribosome-binding protein